jgi:cell division protein FtsI (penicillin-binding protein 3)
VAGSVINDHEPEGKITVSKILEKSSNIGTAKIGIKLGKESLYRYARAFGFGTRTGLPIPGETSGIFREPKDWSNLSLPIQSIGQEIGVTAVQLVSAYSAVANGGLLLEPQIIRKIETAADDMQTAGFSPRIVRRVISQETSVLLRRMMQGVVKQGTGSHASVPGFSVCGKTGTAQKIDPKTKKYFKEKHIASFCGFLPAEDPALVCLVLLDEPQKSYWGGETAAPIFSRIMSRAVTVLDIPSKKLKSDKEIRLLASK